jgi:hypothetical protein
MMTTKRSVLDKAADSPKTKVDWALKVLRENGFVLGALYTLGHERLYEVNGKKLKPQDIYQLVNGYPEWNDRLGIGTARIPKVSNRQ